MVDSDLYKTETLKYGAAVTAPSPAPARIGYVFSGWQNLTSNTVMPAGDLTYTGHLTAATNTVYKVKHIRQDLNGTYPLSGALVETDSKTGTTGAQTAAAAKTYTGFTTGEVTQTAIAADGTTEITIEYSRNSYTVTWMVDSDTYKTETLKYGAAVTAPNPAPARIGYVFSGWQNLTSNTVMPAGDITYTGHITAATNTVYTVKHIRQDLDGTYPLSGALVETDSKTGTTGAQTAAAAKTYTGFTTGEVTQTAIAADGTTEITIEYSRNSYTVTWMVDSDTYKTETLKYGAAVTAPNPAPARIGYVFSGWQNLTSNTVMPAGDLTYTGHLTAATNTVYKVKHIRQDLNGTYADTVELVETESKTGTTGAQTAAAVKTYTGFTTGEVSQTAIAADGTTEITIEYSRNSYTVTWMVNGNTYQTDYPVKYGDAITTPSENPSKIGYTFEGWGNVANNMSANDVTYAAHWKANVYNVTYDENYNTGISTTIDQAYDSDYELPVPSRVGYAFNGWFTSAIGGTRIPDNTKVTIDHDHTLYAQWVEGTNTEYKVEHYQQNVSDADYYIVSADTQMFTGVTNGQTYAEAKAYTGFTPKSFDQTAINADGSTIVKIYYDRNIYTLTFYPANGEESIVSSVNYGAPVAAPNAPIKIGYTFTGWGIVPDTMPATNLSYTAGWKVNTYTVTFDANDGIGSQTTGTVTYGNSYGTLPTPSRTGYTFTGWFTAQNGGSKVLSTDSVSITADQTLYAHWTANTYTVTFFANDDTSTQTTGTVTYGNSYGTLPTLSRTGYTFTGWFTAQNGGSKVLGTDSVSITADQTLYAHWTVNTYTLTLIANDGTGSQTSATLTYSGTYSILPTPTRIGYTFNGWFTDQTNGSKVLNTDSVSITSDQTLYAHWTANTYTIIFDANYGTSTQTNADVTYGSSYGALPTIDRTGYTLTGWYTSQTGGSKVLSTNKVTITEAQTLYAHWTANTYTLTLNANYGSNNQTYATVTYGGTYSMLPTPDRTGYTFNGWFTEQTDGSIVLNTDTVIIAEAQTLYAHWSVNTYTVTLIANDGSNNKTYIDVTYGGTYSELSTIDRTGYTLTGWYTSQTGGSKVFSTDTVIITEAQTLYAHWTANTYTLTLNANYSSNNQTTATVTYGSTYSVLTTPDRTGYTFDGWFTEQNGGNKVLSTDLVTITEDQILYAHWTAKSINVSFSLNTGIGEVPKAIFFTYDGTYSGLPVNSASKLGYTFEGWFTQENGGTEITSLSTVNMALDHTLYAHWTANTYTIIFEANGADSGQMTNQSYTYDLSQSLPVNDYSRTGHTFAGWNTKADGKGTSYADTASVSNLAAGGSVNLYAQWTVNQYTISFDSNGGTAVAAIIKKYNDDVTAPTAPTKSGYTFGVWQKDGTNYAFTVMPAESFTLTAKWITVDYAINYVLNSSINHSNNPASYNIESGNIALSDPSGKTGYTFAGWYTDVEYKNQAAAIAIVNGNTGVKTFYAKWIPNSYTVTFHKNIGDGITATQSITYDEAAKALTANGFSRSGYSFTGWSTNFDGTGTSYTDKQVVQNLAASGNVNLYAKWVTVTYSIIYELNGGTQATGQVTSYTVESNDINLLAPTRQNGYGYMGWYDNAGFTGSAVSTITKGSTGNKTLYAKWGFAGTFTVTNNNNNTFTITRSGNGTADTQNVGQQTVYFRTVNGSAIGGTHFYHLGGSSAAVVFGNGETSKTVTVEEYGTAKAYTSEGTPYEATKYSNIDRTYQLEIVSVVGGGLLGAGTKATRTMAKDSSYTVSSSIYSSYQSFASHSIANGMDISENINNSYDSSKYTGLSGNPLTGRSDLSANVKQYIQDTASSMRVYYSITGHDNGWGMYRFVFLNNHTNDTSTGKGDSTDLAALPSGTKAAFVYGITSNNSDSYTVSLPAAKGAIIATGTSYSVSVYSNSYAPGQSGTYLLYGLNETCGISVGAYNSASAISSWKYDGGTLYSSAHDIKEPTKIGIAPMATGNYKAGEEVTISVVFNEIVANVNGATISGTNLDGSWACSGGKDSNVLFFTGTVKADCNETTILSGINLSGTPTDMAN